MSKSPNTDRDDAPISPEQGEEQLKLLLGRVAAIIGLILVAFGVVSVFTSQNPAAAGISPGAVALALGVLCYFLGSRRLGLTVVILGILTVFFALAATQGLIPGAGPNDRSLPQRVMVGPDEVAHDARAGPVERSA